MVEIEYETRRYKSRHAYRPVRIPPSGRTRNVWSYKLDLTEQPDPMIAAILGDFLFDLRSALDHMLSACAPDRRDQRSFPMLHELPDGRSRASLRESLRGLDIDAQEIVLSFQPWHSPAPHLQPIGIISRPNNRDKHRKFVIVATGLKDVFVRVQTRDWDEEDRPTSAGRFIQANAKVAEFTDSHTPPLEDREVQVHLHGTPHLHVEVPRLGGNQPPDFVPLRHLMVGSIQQVRNILQQLQPYVRRR